MLESFPQSPNQAAESGADRFADKLTIQTPEQALLDFPLAGIGSRFLAIALDTLIQSLAALVFFLVAALILGTRVVSARSDSVWITAVVILVLFIIYSGYFAFFETIWNGQTPGKRFLKVRVIQESGRPINPYQALARNLMRLVDSLPVLYGIGCITALLNRQNKRLGDFVAGTVVVHEKPLAQIRPEWGVARPQPAGPYNLRLLGDGEFQLIETFLQRRSYLDLTVRNRMARQIAGRVANKLTLTGTPDGPRLPGDEQFLEDVLQQYRSGASNL